MYREKLIVLEISVYSQEIANDGPLLTVKTLTKIESIPRMKLFLKISEILRPITCTSGCI